MWCVCAECFVLRVLCDCLLQLTCADLVARPVDAVDAVARARYIGVDRDAEALQLCV